MIKNIVLTGASKGLGLEIAQILLKSDDYIIYGISRSLSIDYRILMDRYGDRVKFLAYDLMNVDNIKTQVFKDFIGRRTAIHGYINNAAMAYDDIITNLQLDLLSKMYRVNVFAPLMMTKNVLRNMLLHKTEGSIVHISSISVHTGYKGLSMYASTKGALEAFSKNTAREWGSLGIRSNAIVAGFMETNMSNTLTDDQKSRIYKRTSLKKATEKSSVAEMVEFLISDKSKSVTGQNIHVDSGTI